MEEGRGRSITPGTPTPTHSLWLKALDMCEHQSEPKLGEPSHEFPGSDGASAFQVNICPYYTESYTLRGSWGMACKDKARESN